MPSGLSGMICPEGELGSWAPYGGRRGKIVRPDFENIVVGVKNA